MPDTTVLAGNEGTPSMIEEKLNERPMAQRQGLKSKPT